MLGDVEVYCMKFALEGTSGLVIPFGMKVSALTSDLRDQSPLVSGRLTVPCRYGSITKQC